MAIPKRSRFILIAVSLYTILGIGWISFSDRLLGLFADVESMVWLSMVKGLSFVLLSALCLYIVLSRVPAPAENAGEEDSVAGTDGGLLFRLSPVIVYGLAVILPVLMLILRLSLPLSFGMRPMLILFMLPISLIGLIGGFGVCLVSTVVTALVVAVFMIPPLGSVAIAADHDLFTWMIMCTYGLIVSVISEALRRLWHQERTRRVQLLYANQALKRNREQFGRLFREAPVAMLHMDEAGTVVAQNNAFLNLFGYTLADLKTIDDWWHKAYPEKDYRDRVRGQWMQAVEQARKQDNLVPEAEYQVACRDGSRRLVNISAILFEDGLLVTFYDMTGFREAEQRLRMWGTSFRHAQLGLAILDASTDTITDVNPAFAAMRGFTVAEMTGQHVGMLFPEDRRKDLADLIAVLNTENHSVLESEHVARDGRRFPVLLDVTALHDDEGAVLSRVVYALDLTDLKRAEREREQAFESVRKSESLFRAIFHDHAAVKLLIHPQTGMIVDANRAAETFYGWPRHVLQRMNMQEINRLPHEEYQQLLHDIRSNGQFHFEMQHCRADGAVYSVEVFSSLIEAGGTALLHSIVHDISDRKRAEHALLVAKNQAEAASQAKSEFLANMSHEIRTPLNGISGMLQLLEMTGLDAEQEEFVSMARKSESRLTRLLSDILDISSIEAGKVVVRNEEFSFGSLCDAVQEMYMGPAREKGLAVRCFKGPDLPARLIGDEGRVQQVLFNLVGNAVKFTDRGEVRLGVEVLERSATGLRLAFTISDTGIGIPEHELGNLFVPFFQVDSSYTRPYQGAGLGLAIVQRLVAQMGGSITVASTLGQGTTFRLELPFALSETGDEDFMSTPMGRPAEPLCILLAEDDPGNQLAMRMLLERHGHEVTLASSGREALDLVMSRDFDCVLMDIQMPDMSGMDVTRTIRDLPPGTGQRDVPVIAMTAYAMDGDREKFLGAGMNAYLSKPVLIDDVLSVLERIRSGKTSSGPRTLH